MHRLDSPQQTMEDAIRERSFPGGVVYLSRVALDEAIPREQVFFHGAFGTTAYDAPFSRRVRTDTLYDIASLSKLFTATAVLVTTHEKQLSLDEPIARFLPAFTASPGHEVTIRQLLNHTSGLGIEVQSLHTLPTSTWIQQIAQAPLRTAPGTKVKYSCTNYFLLARLVENWTGDSLDAWIHARLLSPLQMDRTTFRPLLEFSPDDIAPCEIDEATSEPWHGVAHDEAARTWMNEQGTACGNSGLFSTAEDLSRFARLWLQQGQWDDRQLIPAQEVQRALTETVRADLYEQGLGWHENVSSWMGLRAPQGTAGHAGFTGPTLLIVPGRGDVGIVLNNRVYPSRQGPVRFKYHRRIAEWLYAQ